MRVSNWTKKGYQYLRGYDSRVYKEAFVTGPIFFMGGVALDIQDYDSEKKISILMSEEEAQKMIDKLQAQLNHRNERK